jgi:hypothetical protein
VTRFVDIVDPRTAVQRVTSEYVGQAHVLDARGIPRLTDEVLVRKTR